jgi:hypothetical protein
MHHHRIDSWTFVDMPLRFQLEPSSVSRPAHLQPHTRQCRHSNFQYNQPIALAAAAAVQHMNHRQADNLLLTGMLLHCLSGQLSVTRFVNWQPRTH